MSVIKFLVAEENKPCEIYRRIRIVYGGECASQENELRGDKLFIEGRNFIQNGNRPGRLTMVRTPKIMDTFYTLILAEKI